MIIIILLKLYKVEMQEENDDNVFVVMFMKF